MDDVDFLWEVKSPFTAAVTEGKLSLTKAFVEGCVVPEVLEEDDAALEVLAGLDMPLASWNFTANCNVELGYVLVNIILGRILSC